MKVQSSIMHHANIADVGETPRLTAPSVTLTIIGAVPSLKNSRPIRINRRTGKRFSARSDEASRYIADFAVQVPPQAKIGLGSKDSLLRVTCTAWWPTWRNDADFEIIWDCLQREGVISNDRWIRQKFLYAEIDKVNPRIELTLEEI